MNNLQDQPPRSWGRMVTVLQLNTWKLVFCGQDGSATPFSTNANVCCLKSLQWFVTTGLDFMLKHRWLRFKVALVPNHLPACDAIEIKGKKVPNKGMAHGNGRMPHQRCAVLQGAHSAEKQVGLASCSASAARWKRGKPSQIIVSAFTSNGM